MPTIDVKKTDGSSAGSLELSPDLFAAPQNKVVVREALNGYLANQRQGTHSTKTRAHVSGGGRKPWKQKGTGRARQGSIRAPQWRGGAIVFGPLPRDYRQKVNRQKRQAALRAVLSARLEEGRLLVVDKLAVGNKPRTKLVADMIAALKLDGKVLFVVKGQDPAFLLSVRNIEAARAVGTDELNVYDLLVADHVVLERAAVEALQEERT